MKESWKEQKILLILKIFNNIYILYKDLSIYKNSKSEKEHEFYILLLV